eukprot:CAMPEP_0198206684 /NCGR_PEP_ID=MMETSP1445-20131203/10222_1 /TAXON_ID=36898 /ORGANISM="Pyramimonas sp., Strain CCMP2087" /LENGTH=144 /DNA_ID=CAMNT_0043879463 /DNA_START=480 /DNA_END=910 /DNA_ORIENTATION=-
MTLRLNHACGLLVLVGLFASATAHMNFYGLEVETPEAVEADCIRIPGQDLYFYGLTIKGESPCLPSPPPSPPPPFPPPPSPPSPPPPSPPPPPPSPPPPPPPSPPPSFSLHMEAFYGLNGLEEIEVRHYPPPPPNPNPPPFPPP